MTYRFRKKITITLESNNQLKLQEIDRLYFLAKPKNNLPEDESNYVAISRTSEPLEVLE